MSTSAEGEIPFFEKVKGKMDKPKRKSTRLPMYCYEESRAYFITICTHNRQRLFGKIVTEENQLEKTIEKYPSDYTVGADSISARIRLA